MKILILGVVLALQLAHDPQPCARTEDFLPDGTRVHACACKRMGHGDGEDCTPDHEPQDCTAYCRGEWCRCPIVCDETTDVPPGGR